MLQQEIPPGGGKKAEGDKLVSNRREGNGWRPKELPRSNTWAHGKYIVNNAALMQGVRRGSSQHLGQHKQNYW